MKLRVRALFEGTPLYFEVPVGLGDKTFKWLGMTVSQRFAMLAPNGGLRRRDPIRRGMNDQSLHPPVQVVLPNGQFPHPQALLSDFLGDGDEVTVLLVDSSPTESKTGLQMAPTKWSTLAFGVTGEGVFAGEKSEQGGLDQYDGEALGGGVSAEDTKMAADAEFMKVILKSQMINEKKIRHLVDTHWAKTIAKGMPKMTPAHEAAVKASFIDNWDVLLDVFERYAPDGRLSKSALHSILEEAAVFPAKSLSLLATRVHKRACDATQEPGEMLLHVPGFMVALMLCAQFLHNDTHTASASASASAAASSDGEDGEFLLGNPRAALDEVFSRNLYVLAERLECFCVLKDIFTSEPILALLREYHNDLMVAFTKYAGRSREMPVSINAQNLSELFYDGGLLDEKVDRNNTPASYLFKEVRKGTVVGRTVDPLLGPDDIPPENELTYPEMVEAVCRHGFYKHRGVKADEDGVKMYFDYGGAWSIRDCFVDALNAVRKALKEPRSEADERDKERKKR